MTIDTRLSAGVSMTEAYASWVESRECGSKRGFSSQLSARAAILAVFADGGPDMCEYRCSFCLLWHLTTRIAA